MSKKGIRKRQCTDSLVGMTWTLNPERPTNNNQEKIDTKKQQRATSQNQIRNNLKNTADRCPVQ